MNTTWGSCLLDLEELAKANDYEATANAGLMAACREVGGGTLKSIPYQPNVFAYFYNMDIFEEAGLTKVPETWDEFLDTCQKIKDAGYTPITNDNAYIASLFGYHMSCPIGEPASKGYFFERIESNQWPAGQNTELAMGTAAMYLNGSWLPNEVKDIAGEALSEAASAIRQWKAERTEPRLPTMVRRYLQSTQNPPRQSRHSSSSPI